MNKKYAQFASLWPQIYNKLKAPPPGVNLGTFPGKLPPMNKIVIDPGKLRDNAQAVGYVTTEDVDNNGSLDTIHIASPRLEEAMNTAGVPLQGVQNLDHLSNEELIRILTPFVELLSHEMGHLQDFKPDQENPFPGGEGTADAAAKSAVQPISLGTTNNRNRFEKAGSFKMNIRFIKILNDLADKLDQRGATKIADHIDEMINKYGQAKGPGVDDYSSVFNKKFPEQVAEPSRGLNFQMPSRAKPGQIKPKGDPYTYNLTGPKKDVFIVATTPPGKEFAIGRKIVPGDKGFQDLYDEAFRMGLFDNEIVPNYPGAHYPDQLEPQERVLAEKLGLGSAENLVPENVEPFLLAKRKIFNEEMGKIADHISQALGYITNSGAAPVKNAIPLLKNPDLTGSEAIQIFNQLLPNLIVTIGQESADQIRNEFDQKVNLWQGVQDALDLKQLLEAKHPNTERNLADDGKEEQTEVQKMAALKDEYQKIFWFDPKTPFNRSNAAFKR